jgi:hypothetical protein
MGAVAMGGAYIGAFKPDLWNELLAFPMMSAPRQTRAGRVICFIVFVVASVVVSGAALVSLHQGLASAS